MMIFIGTLFCNLHRDANGLHLRQSVFPTAECVVLTVRGRQGCSRILQKVSALSELKSGACAHGSLWQRAAPACKSSAQARERQVRNMQYGTVMSSDNECPQISRYQTKGGTLLLRLR